MEGVPPSGPATKKYQVAACSYERKFFVTAATSSHHGDMAPCSVQGGPPTAKIRRHHEALAGREVRLLPPSFRKPCPPARGPCALPLFARHLPVVADQMAADQ